MKKILTLLLVVCVCMGVAACTANDKSDGMANPLVEVESADDILEQLDIFILPPEGAENVRYSIIADELAQADFTLNGIEYTERIQKTAEPEDISGVYTTMETQKDMSSFGFEYHIAYNEGDEGVATWYDTLSESSYSVHMRSGASEQALQEISEELIPAG